MLAVVGWLARDKAQLPRLGIMKVGETQTSSSVKLAPISGLIAVISSTILK